MHNEEQWLMGHEDAANGQVTHFVYDHTGNRILKGSLGAAIASTNGQATATSFVVDPYTIYANAYYVEQPYSTVSTISKHYYMGMQRIATNLGGTEIMEEPGGEPGMQKTNPTGNNAVVNNLMVVLANFGAKEGTDYTREQITQTPNFTDYYPQDSSMQTQANKTETSSPSALGGDLGVGFEGAPIEPGNEVPSPRLLYYYHPDYLGNVEYITDADGLPYQYFFYSPWGEPLADQKANANANWDSPYKFNGKEQDEETGLYYYGARYYNPQVSVWLGVDPILKHHETPYSSFSNNPIMILDPDGRDTSFVKPSMKAEFDQTYKSIQDSHKLKKQELSQAEADLQNAKNKVGKWFKQQSVNKLNREYEAIGALKQSFDDIINSDLEFLINALPNPDNKPTSGSTSYRCDGIIEIKYYAGNDHSLVHEVRHGQGFLLKEWGVHQNGMYALDYYDELAGYNAAADYLRLVKGSSFQSVYGDTTIDRLIYEHYPGIKKEKTLAQ